MVAAVCVCATDGHGHDVLGAVSLRSSASSRPLRSVQHVHQARRRVERSLYAQRGTYVYVSRVVRHNVWFCTRRCLLAARATCTRIQHQHEIGQYKKAKDFQHAHVHVFNVSPLISMHVSFDFLCSTSLLWFAIRTVCNFLHFYHEITSGGACVLWLTSRSTCACQTVIIEAWRAVESTRTIIFTVNM